MCVDHNNTPTAVLDGKLSPEETSVSSQSAAVPVEMDFVPDQTCAPAQMDRFLHPVAPNQFKTVIFAV